MWLWRDRVSFAIAGAKDGKVSEGIEVPDERLADAVGTVEAGRRHGVIGLLPADDPVSG